MKIWWNDTDKGTRYARQQPVQLHFSTKNLTRTGTKSSLRCDRPPTRYLGHDTVQQVSWMCQTPFRDLHVSFYLVLYKHEFLQLFWKEIIFLTKQTDRNRFTRKCLFNFESIPSKQSLIEDFYKIRNSMSPLWS